MAKSTYTKDGALKRWKSLPEGLPILPNMTPIPYKSTGSTYGACGIRIDGNPAFIDAVLSRIKDVIQGEAVNTRLGLSRNAVQRDFKACHNADQNAEVCYIRLHVRGREGAMLQAFLAR